MLNLKPKQKTRIVTHTESGARFEVRHLTPAKREAMRNRHMKGGELKLVEYMKEAAQFAIVNWWEVGNSGETAECSDENKEVFGANFATSIMPWLLSEAESLDVFFTDEKAAAKND